METQLASPPTCQRSQFLAISSYFSSFPLPPFLLLFFLPPVFLFFTSSSIAALNLRLLFRLRLLFVLDDITMLTLKMKTVGTTMVKNDDGEGNDDRDVSDDDAG